MTEAVEGIASVLEQLSRKVLELERRIAVLEGQPARPAPSVAAPPTPAEPAAATPIQRPKPPETWRGFPAEKSDQAVPVLGKAILAMAGAYLLRAISESGAVPKLAVLIVAIVYAGLCLLWAVRVHAKNRFAGITYGVTSALILSPLLWESTVRFQILSPAFTGVVLVGFVVLASALAWRAEQQVFPWLAVLASVATSIALIFASHELVPLTATLLAIALVTEISACRGHHLGLRIVPALAADLAVWLLVDVLTGSGGVPESYHAVAPGVMAALCFALLAIYGGSLGVRNFIQRERITYFEIVQGVLAFALASWGALRATQGSAAAPLAVLFLLLTAVCYWGALSRFTDEAYTRNRRVYATWAAALLVAGSYLLFPPRFQLVFLCAAALAATFVYTRMRKMSLGWHASVFLAAAAAVSPLPAYLVSAMTGTVPGAPVWEVWIVALAAVGCYLVGARVTETVRTRRMLWVVPALVVGFAWAAMTVALIVKLAGGLEVAPSRLSVVRTVVNCALALVLAFVGSWWKRVELGWVAYAAVGFGAIKMLLEDLRFGNTASMVVSLLFYGIVLILLPKMVGKRVSD